MIMTSSLENEFLGWECNYQELLFLQKFQFEAPERSYMLAILENGGMSITIITRGVKNKFLDWEYNYQDLLFLQNFWSKGPERSYMAAILENGDRSIMMSGLANLWFIVKIFLWWLSIKIFLDDSA